MNERERVILGGLLHDIGKFYMRTGRPAEGYGREEWSGEVGPAGAHARWSASFFSRHVPTQWREAGWLALTHHAPKPGDHLAQIVQEADRLAARLDRTKRPTDERGDISRDRLQAPLEQIVLPRELGERWDRVSRFTHPLRRLSLEREAVFPADGNGGRDLKPEYADLWNDFTREVERLRQAHEGHEETFDAYLTSLLSLLEVYAWCIPSATYVDYPDVPLYDHLKVTAAIAGCLHATDGQKRFLFVEGDLSGIQDFLYESAAPSQTQDGVAVRLRGKSFYLDLSMRTLAERCRQDLGLPATNILWCSGGHFALLAPDTVRARETLGEFRGRADRWCWEEFLGDLGLVLAVVPAREEDLSDVAHLRGRVASTLREEKQRRFARRLDDPGLWELPLKNEVCRACGRDAWKEQDFVGEEDSQKKCPRCRAFESHGQRLPRTRRLALCPAGGSTDEGTVSFAALDLDWKFAEGWDEVPENASLVLSLGGRANPRLDFLPENPRPNTGYVVSPYNTVLPMKGHAPRTFEDMAEEADGAKFLGILRMDVDNLGAVFALGIPERERSLSKLAALSRCFDWFFRGWVPIRAAQEDVYVTYSGGDDLFLVGPWDRMVKLALGIREDFEAFCCKNASLTISGGLALVKRRFPIGRAAEQSAELLNRIAKRPQSDLPEDCDKASLAIFNRKVPWPVLQRVIGLAEETILPNLREGKIRRAMLHHWLRLHREYFEHEKEASNSGGAQAAWFAKLLYGIARNVQDTALALLLRRELVSLPHWLPVLVGYTALRLRRAEGNASGSSERG